MSTNVFTISWLSIEPPPPPPPVNLVLQHCCKALQSLYCTIRRLFVLFVDYSRTIRTIRRLFADYSYYSSTIRRLFVLFVDYSHYSSTIRTIRFTILVLSIANTTVYEIQLPENRTNCEASLLWVLEASEYFPARVLCSRLKRKALTPKDKVGLKFVLF